MPYFLMTFQKINLGNISNQNYLSFPLTIQEVWYIIIKQFNEITCVEAHSTNQPHLSMWFFVCIGVLCHKIVAHGYAVRTTACKHAPRYYGTKPLRVHSILPRYSSFENKKMNIFLLKNPAKIAKPSYVAKIPCNYNILLARTSQQYKRVRNNVLFQN